MGFDAAWYAATHAPAGASAETALAHYIITGRSQGLSPNMFFDEAWYLAANPDVRESVARGDLACGYEHYCTVGYPTRAPHWLYDDEVYREDTPELTDLKLIELGCANRYDHYLKHGAQRGLRAHVLFDPVHYVAHRDIAAGIQDGGIFSAFHHYLRNLPGDGTDAVTSVYFDPAWYRRHCPAAGEAIAAGIYRSPLHHFLAAPAAERGPPLRWFSEAFYAAQAEDAPDMVASGAVQSLYEHFLKLGVFARLSPGPDINLAAYALDDPGAVADVEKGRVRDLFARWLSQKEAEMAPQGEMFGMKILIEIDNTIFCPPDGLVLYGWMIVPPGVVPELTLVCGKRRTRLEPDRFIKVPRPDVIAAHKDLIDDEGVPRGFMTYAPASLEPGAAPVLEITWGSGTAQRTLPEPAPQGFAAIKSLLGRFALLHGALERGFNDVVGPAMISLAHAWRSEPVSWDAVPFGEIPANPEVSVIIPLYGRTDFIEYQLALFTAHQAGIRHELIYVLDDPKRTEDTMLLAESLFARFGIPFRLVPLSRNTGYAGANNIGLGLARGRMVCLLNSDVFPHAADWLGALHRRLRGTKGLGAVGPLLLYEDGSAQHQGIRFKNEPQYAGWPFPFHIGKGRQPDEARGLRRFPAITGACMLMERAVLERLGGLDENYIVGDFEDTDLCMRLAEQGLDCGVDMDVSMYHLERQSQEAPSTRWRMNLTMNNAWLFQRRWAQALAKGTQA